MSREEHPTVEDAIEHRDPWWWATARQALEHLAEQGRPFESYDLTEIGVTDPDHPARWGALFSHAAREGVIVPCGFTVSRRPTRSHGLTRLWRGCRNHR